MSPELFNSLEGAFWFLLSVSVFLVAYLGPKLYRNLSIYTAIFLFLFGVSDFLQIWFGSFFAPGMEWLLIWKIVNLSAIVIAFVVYIRLRLT